VKGEARHGGDDDDERRRFLSIMGSTASTKEQREVRDGKGNHLDWSLVFMQIFAAGVHKAHIYPILIGKGGMDESGRRL
jgi:hypothetical protein